VYIMLYMAVVCDRAVYVQSKRDGDRPARFGQIRCHQ